MTVTDQQIREMYRRMSRIRLFENTTKDLLLKGELYGAFHTSTGQEASIVGSCMALRAVIRSRISCSEGVCEEAGLCAESGAAAKIRRAKLASFNKDFIRSNTRP